MAPAGTTAWWPQRGAPIHLRGFLCWIPKKVNDMGAGDEAGNAGQGLWGKAKEAVGRLRGDRPQKNAGKDEQRTALLKRATEQAKDAGKEH